MASCPACGVEVPPNQLECPSCHLGTSLFEAVQEAAGRGPDTDPAYVQTVAELLRSIDLEPVPASPAAPLLRPSAGSTGPTSLQLPRAEPSIRPEPLQALGGLPPLPPTAHAEPLQRRADEYLRLARHLDLDLTSLAARASTARLTDDERGLDAVVREMFVNVASALAVSFEAELARRNEIAQLVPTPSADVELNAVRGAIDSGDLSGAERRLDHVRTELGRLEEIWATGRILLASCDLIAETIGELGGDPTPALGPSREGRRRLAVGDSAAAERLLARGTLALWAVLEPRFFDELRRLRDRLLEKRTAGADLGPALGDLRAVSTELHRRNFVGTIVAYRALRDELDLRPPGGAPAPPPPAPGPGSSSPPT